ncbi:glycosyltransferase 87 family protein [Mariniluteicoccus flavus]
MTRDTSQQATAEPFVRLVSRAIGGLPGRHARPTPRRWATPLVVAYAVGTAMWVLAWLRWVPCRQEKWDKAPDVFAWQCYTDIVPLYAGRGLADGNTPYFDTGPYQVLEYPVGTGYLMELARRITAWLGAPVGPGLDAQQLVDASNTFMAVNAVLLFALFLVALWSHVRGSLGREWDVLMFVASPSVLLTGLINWDMLPVALTALGVMFWARKRPALAGIALGLSMAAKLYAGFLLGPLLLLCLRGRRMKDFFATLGGFLIAWVATNLPVMIGAPEEWKLFWTFNADREGDFGSIWYLGVLNQTPMPDLNVWSTGLFLLGCLLVGVLILLAPQRPRIGQVMFLVLMAFLLTNKVYSPQYVLWALPFLALCRPRWRDWIIWTIGEWLYFMAIWGHLGQYLKPGDEGPDKLFWAATVLRLATEAYVSAMVVRDVLRPQRDVVRATATPGGAYVDDPSGGTLDGAPDAPWFTRFRRRTLAWLGGALRVVPRAPRPGVLLPGFRADLARPELTSPGRTSPDRRGLWWVGGVWLASRLLLVGVAIYVVATSTDKTFAQAFSNWDVAHFVGIAEHGYLADPKRMAFFPGLPLLLAGFKAVGIPAVAGGIVVSMVASLVAAAALYRLGGFWAAALWLVAPTMVFTFVPYTEALFCAFAFWAWVWARQDRWAIAGLCAAGAASIRVSGLFLVFALAVMVLTWPVHDGESRLKGWLRRGVWLVLPVAVIGAYMVYLHGLTGSWNAWNEAQQAGWSRGWTWPWQSVMNTVPVIVPGGYADHPGWAIVFRFEVISMIVGLVATGWLFARRAWAEAAWVAVQVLAFATSYWLFSVNRAVLLWFPVWLIAAELIRWRPDGVATRTVKGLALIAWVVTSIGVGIWWAATFYNGQWSS